MDRPVSAAQQRVLEFLQRHPGAAIQSVADNLGIAHTTATYHLEILRRLGRVTCDREGRTLRHYAGPGGEELADRLRPLLDDPKRRSILEFLAAAPNQPLRINHLAQNLGLTHGFVTRALATLIRHGVVKLQPRGPRYWIQTIVDLSPYVRAAGLSGPPADPYSSSVLGLLPKAAGELGDAIGTPPQAERTAR